MIKTILIILLGVFFLVNGINHFYNSHFVEEYAEKRGLFEPKIMVFLSGLLLLFGGLSMIYMPIYNKNLSHVATGIPET